MHSDRETKRKRNTPNEGSIQGQFQSRFPESNGGKSNENAGFIGIRTERTRESDRRFNAHQRMRTKIVRPLLAAVCRQ